MTNWKQEYEELYRFLLGMTILIIIALIMFVIGFRGTTKLIQEKQNKIWQQSIEIEVLKEQLQQKGVE